MRRFVLPVAAAVVLVAASPIIGELRAAIQRAFPEQYTRIIAAIVFVAIASAVVIALVRIRERRALRYGLIALAILVGTGYALIARTGNPSVDVVERFHFVEYGAITFLFYRAWLPLGDRTLLILPVLAALLVGVCEEWVQWFVPARIGELRDVLLNLWAIGCGLLFSIAVHPPERFRETSYESRRLVRAVASVLVVVLAAFIDAVHLGYSVNDSRTGSFRSLYSRDELLALSRDRSEKWRKDPPLTWSRYSREDQFFSEGLAHVRRRNECWAKQDFRCAWQENLILETYFAPLLDTPSYVAKTGHRWPAEQRATAATHQGSEGSDYWSDADEVRIWPGLKPSFWFVPLAILVVLLWPERQALTRSV